MSDQITVDRKHEADLVKEIGMFSIKTVVTLCSGGFIVILTFLSSLSKDSLLNVDVDRVKIGLILLLVGLVFCALTLFVSFIVSQRRLKNDESTAIDRSYLLLVLQAAPLLLAFCGFVLGVCTAISGVMSQ